MKLCVPFASDLSRPTHVGGAPHAQQLVSGLLKPPDGQPRRKWQLWRDLAPAPRPLGGL